MSKKPKTSTSEDIEIPKHLPLVLTFKIIQNKDCKFIIRTLSESKRQIKRLEITKSQFKSLTDKIDSEAFDNLKRKAADHVADEGTYSLKPWPEIKKFVEDPEIQQAANKFYTKCLFKYLYDTYKGDTMKKKWYDAIKKENKLDLKNFGYFTNVTRIGGFAFDNNQLTNVRIPDSVTSIGDSAFSKNQLTSVTIPNSVTRIGDRAFFNNVVLTSVEFDTASNVTSIGRAAFANNQLRNVMIPDSVTSIESSAFESNQLTSVRIPDSVTKIRNWAFQHNKLTSVEFGTASNVTDIGAFAFQNNQLTSVRIPDSVTSIEDYAFQDNKLTSVEFGTASNVTDIGAFAFQNNQLTSVRIPASVTELAENEFDDGVTIIREGDVIPDNSKKLLKLKF